MANGRLQILGQTCGITQIGAHAAEDEWAAGLNAHLQETSQALLL